MKNQKIKILICVSIILLFKSLSFANSWNSIGPSDINVNNYYSSPYYEVLCTSNGILINEGGDWNGYSNNLPVWIVTDLDATTLLMIMGNGSCSDGIYTFNLNNHQFTFVDTLLNPHFLEHNEIDSTYYVGYEYGLCKSMDGVTWSEISYFNNKDCMAMIFYQNHFIVSADGYIYYSNNSGLTWSQSLTGSLPITDLAFDTTNSIVYGIFPGDSYSSGLWSSEDFGEIWVVEFCAMNMSSVYISNNNFIFVGWEESFGNMEGVALWIPGIEELIFVNNELPNLNINKLTNSTIVGNINVVCCTECGAYIHEIAVGIASITGTITENGVPPEYPVTAVAVSSEEDWAETAEMNVNGTYILENLPIGEYYILAVSSETPPIYYIDVYDWEDATSLWVQGTYSEIDIHLNQAENGGNFSLNGFVFDYNNNPVFNTTIIMVNSLGNIESFTKTDVNGYYEVNNLIADNYEAIATKIFYETDSEMLTIPETTSFNFIIQHTNPTSADDMNNNISSNKILLTNYPNPFSNSTIISFLNPNYTMDIKIEVYNIRGELIKTLEPINKDINQITNYCWDGKDGFGKLVCSGIYFYRLSKKDLMPKVIPCMQRTLTKEEINNNKINIKKCLLLR